MGLESTPDSDGTGAGGSPPGWLPIHWILVLLGALTYGALVVQHWSRAYLDFGDGNYIYIARRIAEGAVVYRDILAPQPPCHLFLGALIWRLIGVFGAPEPVFVFRGFSLGLHLLTYLLVIRLAWRGWGRAGTAVLAGWIFLILPIGLWWSLAYQSEPLETVFLLGMILAALRATRVGDVAAGVFAALAGLTNATAAPFLLVMILFMLARNPRRALRMALPCVVLAGGVTFGLEWWTGGAFLTNVVHNQVGTYPDRLPELLNYALGKLLSQGQNVLYLEGGFLFFAMLGLARLLRESPLAPQERAGLAWYCIATLVALVYVTKGGTMDYIFSLSEPAVAVLAAGELAAWGRRWVRHDSPEPGSGWAWGAIPFVLPKVAMAGVMALFLLVPALHFFAMLAQQSGPIELNELQTEKLVHTIEKHSAPEQPILAPPYYAVLADRTLWGDYSELFIWIFKYRHAVQAGDPEGEGWRKIRGMAEAIGQRRLGIVVLEMDQTGIAPEVMLALQQTCRPLAGQWLPGPDRYLFTTRNTRLGLFVPAPADETPEAFQARQAAWQAFKDELLAVYGAEGVRNRFGMWYGR